MLNRTRAFIIKSHKNNVKNNTIEVEINGGRIELEPFPTEQKPPSSTSEKTLKIPFIASSNTMRWGDAPYFAEKLSQ